MMKNTQPQVLLGNPLSGEGADSNRTAYAKYNNHIHASATSSLLSYDIKPGDSVLALENGVIKDLFPESTVVSSITSDAITCSAAALLSSTPDTQIQFFATTLSNVEVQASSNLITINPVDGFLKDTALSAALSKTIRAEIFNPQQSSSYPLLILPPYKGVITSVSHVCSENACNLTLLKNGDSISTSFLSSNQASLSTLDFNLSFDTSFTEQDVVSVEVENSTGPLVLTLNVHMLLRP